MSQLDDPDYEKKVLARINRMTQIEPIGDYRVAKGCSPAASHESPESVIRRLRGGVTMDQQTYSWIEDISNLQKEIHRARTDPRYWDEFNTISSDDAIRKENDRLIAELESMEILKDAIIENANHDYEERTKEVDGLRQKISDLYHYTTELEDRVHLADTLAKAVEEMRDKWVSFGIFQALDAYRETK